MIAGLVLLLAACGSGEAPTDAPDAETATAPPAQQTAGQTASSSPAPDATPTAVPTPTLTAEEQLEQLLLSVEEKLAAMSTATFDMIDETESGAPFFGTTFKSLRGKVKPPDGFQMKVTVVSPGLGFVEIQMLAVGEEAYMKFSEDAPWIPLALDQIPFDFAGIGVSLSQLLPAMSNVALTGREAVGDTQAIRIEGTISSESMSGLIRGADPGHSITLTFWIDEADHSVRQLRIAGRLFNDDGPETVRLIDITGVNVPVDIQLPDAASRQ